jgi:hypothetical protein
VRPLAVTRKPFGDIADRAAACRIRTRYKSCRWFGIGAPKNTSKEIDNKLNRKISLGLAHSKIQARLADLGGTVLSGSPGSSPQAFIRMRQM